MGRVVARQACSACQERGADRQGNNLHIYDDGKGYCHACGHVEKNVNGSEEEPKKYVRRESVSSTDVSSVETISSIRALPERGISREIAERYGVRASVDETSGKNSVHFYPYYRRGKLAAYKQRRLPKQFSWIGDTKDGKGLFGQQLYENLDRGKKFLVCVEGEADCLSVAEILKRSGKDYAVVSIQDGANAAGTVNATLKANAEFLSSFEKVLLCFDNDPAGEVYVQAVADWLCTMTSVAIMSLKDTEYKDINEILMAEDYEAFWSAWKNCKVYQPESIVHVSDVSFEDVAQPVEAGYPFEWECMNRVYKGLRKGELTVACGGSGIGKCHGKDTPILMFDGSVKMVQDVKVGDKLMGVDSEPRTVLSLARGTDHLYRIKQGNGDDYIVNSEHILSLRTNRERKQRGWEKDGIVNLKVTEFMKMPDCYKKHNLKGWKAEVMHFGNEASVWEPYFIGLWLAEGTKNRASITLNDDDYSEALKGELNGFCERNGFIISSSSAKEASNCRGYYIGKGWNSKKNDFIQNDVKTIPINYRTAKYEDRLELLAGMLDGDGYMSFSGFEICFKDPSLADEFCFVARSVGLRVNNTLKIARCQNNFVGEYRRVTLFGDTDKIPTRLKRKQAAPRKQIKNALRYGIEVEPIGEGDYYGFELDGNHLYLLGDFTVTHNTSVVREMVDGVVRNNPKVVVGVMSLEDSLSKAIRSYCALRLAVPLGRLTTNPDCVDKEEYRKVFDSFAKSGQYVFFDSSKFLDLDKLMNKVEYFARSAGCDYLIIDNLTLIAARSKETDERRAIDNVMASLAGLVASTGMGIILVNHLTRQKGVSPNNGDMVEIQHLRGSGAIEAFSDNIIAAERNQQSDNEADKNTVLLRALKNRAFGITGMIGKLQYIPETGRLVELKSDF